MTEFPDDDTTIRTILAIVGEADAALLRALDVDLDQAQVYGAHGRYQLPADAQQTILETLEADAVQFRTWHERVLGVLSARVEAGDTAVEPQWDAVFERLASRLYANDSDGYLALLAQVADLPLTTPLPRQRRRFYQGGSWLVRDEYKRAAAVFDDLLGWAELTPALRARTLNARAVVSRLTGQLEAAMRGYGQALALWRQLHNRYYEGTVLLNMGIIGYELRHYDEAEARLRQAEAIFTDIGAAHWLAVVHNELGLIRRDLGQWQAALAYFRQYIDQRRAVGADHHVGLGLLNRGEVLLFQGDLAAAIASLTEALGLIRTRPYLIDVHLHLALAWQAQGDFEQAGAALAQARRIAEEIGRREILPHVYYHIGDLARRQGETDAALAAWREAVAIIEETRQPLRDEALKISLLGRWQQVYESLVLLCLALDQPEDAFSWAERARARAFAEAMGGEVAVGGEGAAMTVTAVQAALPAETTLLCYFTTGVLEQDVPLLRAIPKENPLRDHLLLTAETVLFTVRHDTFTATHCGFDPNMFASASPRGFDIERFLQPAVLARLRTLLLPAELAGRVVIVPHGPLHRVPFAALRAGAALALAPSASLLTMAAPISTGTGCLAVGYDGVVNGRRLQHTEAEVQQVARLLDGTAWRGPSLEKEPLQRAAAAVRWLHIACHGWFDDVRPLASYLQISPDAQLTAQEVLGSWSLRAELVTLSACKTGVSQILRGDEPMGLVRAFLAAGARAVLVSQWAVDDVATALLMASFYAQVADNDGADLSQALAVAQTWLRQLSVADARRQMAVWQLGPPPEAWDGLAETAVVFAEPVYWAGFVLVIRGFAA